MKNFLILILIILLWIGAYFWRQFYNNWDIELFSNSKTIPQENNTQTNNNDQQQEKNSELKYYENTDTESAIPFMISAPNSEWIVWVFNDWVPYQLLLITKDKEYIEVYLNEDWLPNYLSYKWTIAKFSNYTTDSVDIEIERNDWTTDKLEKSKINAFYFTDQVHADGYVAMAWTAMNAISCGVWLWTILFSWWATSPMAYLWCWALSVRMATYDMKTNDCEWDLLQCVTDQFFDIVAQHWPQILSDWTKIYWKVRNSITNTEIKLWTVNWKLKNSSQEKRWEWSDGNYEFYTKDNWIYELSLVAEWFTWSSFFLNVTDSKIQIYLPNNEIMLDDDITKDTQNQFNLDLYLDPDWFIMWEVIDSKEWTLIPNAKIIIYEWNNILIQDETVDDWTFSLQPELSNSNKKLKIEISASWYETYSKDFTLTYEIKENSYEYEIAELPEIIKLIPKDVDDFYYSMNFYWPVQESSSCTKEFFSVFKDIRFKVVDWEIVPLPKDDCEDCIVPLLSWTVKNWRVEMIFDLFFWWKIDITWSLWRDHWSGQWENPYFRQQSEKWWWESHHYKPCEWTWWVTTENN